MRHALFLSLRDDVSLSERQDGATIRFSEGELIVDDATPTTLAALRRLCSDGGDEAALIDPILNDDGPIAMARFCHLLAVLSRRSLLTQTVQEDGDPLASLVAVSRHFSWSFDDLVPDKAYVLSRFAYLRRDGQHAVLESPRCHARLIVHDRRASAVTHALVRPRTLEEVAAASSVSHGAVEAVMGLLVRAGFLAGVTESGTSAEDEDPSLQCWEFHDLLFHASSRMGRHERAAGATYRFTPGVPAPPALKTVDASHWIDLDRPDAGDAARRFVTFDSVQARRRSVRAYGPQPITTRQLGEFLFRVARVYRCCDADVDTPGGPARMSFALRPYPNAGALYELELYVAVQSCDALKQGLYYYDPLNHRLGCVDGDPAHVEQLLLDASRAAALGRDQLQVLLVITARFQRIAWKYESIAYALVLKNVGVLLQTMYLVATAMQLGPCALGSGDSDVFALAGGTDYYTELSVGEFLLGCGAGEEAEGSEPSDPSAP